MSRSSRARRTRAKSGKSAKKRAKRQHGKNKSLKAASAAKKRGPARAARPRTTGKTAGRASLQARGRKKAVKRGRVRDYSHSSAKSVQPSHFQLSVLTDDDTELVVMDSSLSVLRRSIGPLKVPLPTGLYKVRAVRGGARREQIVDLDKNRDLMLWVSSFPAIAPIGPMLGGAVSKVEHVADQALGRTPKVRPLRQGILFFGHRDFPTGSPRAKGDSALAGIRLLSWKPEREGGQEQHEPFDAIDGKELAKREIDGTEWASTWRDVKPGTYVVEFEDEGRRIRQSVLVVPGWQTRVFVRRRPVAPNRQQVDLSIQMAQPKSNVVYYDHYQTIETARNALEAQRPIFTTTRLIDQLLYGKFDNPIAGIVGLHLFLTAVEQARDLTKREGQVRIALGKNWLDKADDTIDTVLRNLSQLLGVKQGAKKGEPLSDLVALQVRAGRKPGKEPVRLTAPPMFWAGWEALRQSTGPGKPVSIGFPLWVQIALCAPCGPYFGWEPSSDPTALLARFDFAQPGRQARSLELNELVSFKAAASDDEGALESAVSHEGLEILLPPKVARPALKPLDDEAAAAALGIPHSVLSSLKQIS